MNRKIRKSNLLNLKFKPKAHCKVNKDVDENGNTILVEEN